MISMLNHFLVKKTTLIFPSSNELWEFFKFTEVKEFRLDSAKCSVTGRFLTDEIEKAIETMKARVDEGANV